MPTMSCETISSSVYARMPARRPVSARALTAALISSTEASRPSVQTRSTTEPSGTGTRIDMPSSLPLSSGITSPIARAAPVEVGMIESAAARARRRSLCGMSCRR